MLKGRKVLLGVTGSIAAYKTPELVRQLVKAGAQVQVIMTTASKDFVAPVALATVSKNPVLTSFYKRKNKSEWTNHVELGLWADVFLIAPASANTIAKFANGICDNLLTAVFLSARCPVFVAPAMDVDMYRHFATQKNIAKLKKNSIRFIGPDSGELASGLVGAGRMTEPSEIVKQLTVFFSTDKPLKGKHALVSAGPTYEDIDPVRFIGNHSSGKMGIALANELFLKGADVTLVAGPKVDATYNKGIRRIDIITASQMLEACKKEFVKSDIAIMAAAVADFAPVNASAKKIKKNGAALSLQLKPTADILAELGKSKTKNQMLVGFALETNDEVENAKKKLKNKNLDFIVLNSLNKKNRPFNSDTNQITILDRKNKIENFKLKPKAEVAADIVSKILSLLK